MAFTQLSLRREITDADRAGVRADIPELELIGDAEMCRLAVEAWCFSLCCSDFHRISEMPPEGNPGSPVLRRGSQADHIRIVTRLSMAMAREAIAMWPEVRVDHDVLVTGAICHDVGKPYEFDPANRARWAADPSVAGQPSFRHSVFGMHVCLTVGLPVEVAHIAVGHSFEGQYMGVSSECMIVRLADHDSWQIAGALGMLTPESLATRAAFLRARPM